MDSIPSKCPRCGKSGSWREEISPCTSGVPTSLGRIRVGLVVTGLFSGFLKRNTGLDKVTYRCRRCGFRRDYRK